MARFFVIPGRVRRSANNINLRAVPGLTAEQGRLAGPGARESARNCCPFGRRSNTAKVAPRPRRLPKRQAAGEQAGEQAQ